MAKDRLFSVYNVNGTFTNPELAYPWRHEYIPIWLSGLLSVLVPILIYILMALRIRSFWDLNNAVRECFHYNKQNLSECLRAAFFFVHNDEASHRENLANLDFL